MKKILKLILNYLSKLTVEQEDVVGVDISPSCIRVAQLESSKKKWTLTKLGYKYIDGSSLNDVEIFIYVVQFRGNKQQMHLVF